MMWTFLMAALTIAGGQVCTAACVAWGNDPGWRIEAEGNRWTLQLDGASDVLLAPGAWQETPRGRRLTGTIGKARFTLLATFGSCGRGADSQGRASSYFAVLSLPNGRILRGCMADAPSHYPG